MNKNNNSAKEEFRPIYNRFIYKFNNAKRFNRGVMSVRRCYQVIFRLRRASGNKYE